MTRGGFLLVACSGLVIAGCSAPSVQVRAISDPAAKLRNGGDELASARSMLALGNAGLALEGFRNLRISQPTNPDVYAGIAECYVAMGRYDLAATNYEAALAYAPHDAALLSALADSLDAQGETAKAANVRAELAQLTTSSQSPSQEIAAQPTAVTKPAPAISKAPVPQVGSITVMLPPARPAVARVASQTPQMTAAVAAPAAQVKKADSAPAPAKVVELAKVASPPNSTPTAAVDAEPAPLHIAAQVSSPVPVQLGATDMARLNPEGLKVPGVAVAVVVPAPARIDAPSDAVLTARPASPRPLVPAAVTLVSKPQTPRPSFPTAAELVAELVAMEPANKPREPGRRLEEQGMTTGPRLERLSTGEVALVTTPAPLWKSRLASKALSHTAVQWLPIRTAQARPAIQLLNAARSQGLAAWSRMALVDRGWRRIDIGNYGVVRQRSLVLYSGDHAPLARRLAAQFNCKAIKVDGKPRLVVLLGRDAASKKAVLSRA